MLLLICAICDSIKSRFIKKQEAFACKAWKWIHRGKNGNKYLIFDSIYENEKLLKKYNDVFNGIKTKLKQ